MDMTIPQLITLLMIGFCAGMLSGLVGVGGGLIIVPALVAFLHFNQFQAQGTSLAVLLLPVGIFAVINYHKQGYINIPSALIIATAFIAGSYFGSRYALRLPEYKVKFFFGAFMLYVALRMLWTSGLKWWHE